jgi:hypothetical protein
MLSSLISIEENHDAVTYSIPFFITGKLLCINKVAINFPIPRFEVFFKSDFLFSFTREY